MNRTAMPQPALELGFGFAFADLYQRNGLVRLDQQFVQYLREAERALADGLLDARTDPGALTAKSESELLVALAPHLEDYLAELFGIEDAVTDLAARHHELAPLYSCKRMFVQRRAMNRIKPEEAAAIDGPAIEGQLAAHMGGSFTELGFARLVSQWQADEAIHAQDLELALHYAAWAVHTPAGQARHLSGVLFKAPVKLDYYRLVPVVADDSKGFRSYRLDHLRRRRGFALTDPGTDLVGALDQTNYCIWCHEQGRDSCSHGLREKAPTGGGSPPFKRTVFGVQLAGCPLEEKISEFQKIKTEGLALGALAMICVDNPMVAATGHRICNDCMKSCIYQKQEPVDIPQAETRTLKDVLELPWGFEIYSLLTRWNPLDLRRPYPRSASGRRVLVVGTGPAGFTLAHHLMNDGHHVVGIDGLKIEPLPTDVCGVGASGERTPFRPIHDVRTLYESLDDRVMAGFGGVAEYGITVRWDKNFLKLIRLLLERRARVPAVRRRSLRRYAHARRRFRCGLRSRRAVRGRRPPHRAGAAQRTGARRAHRLGLSDGATADRCCQDRLGRKSADPTPRGGSGWRIDCDRHGHRIACLLPGAGGEVPASL